MTADQHTRRELLGAALLAPLALGLTRCSASSARRAPSLAGDVKAIGKGAANGGLREAQGRGPRL
jgi:hypothetical protein